MNYKEEYKSAIESMFTSFRLKRALKDFDSADILDALRDAERLVSLLELKYKDLEGNPFMSAPFANSQI
jgi:hypothetical protein